MKNWWLTQSARINALSLRERVFMFVSVMVCCLAVVDVVWLSPAQTAHTQLMQRFDKQTAELKRVRTELRSSVKSVDTAQPSHDELAKLQSRTDAVNQAIKHALPSKAEASALTQAVAQLLRRHESLTLENMAAMPAELAFEKNPQSFAPEGTVAPAELTRQRLELTVSGPYPELMRYVRSLETALPYIRWAGFSLKSEKQVSVLTLHLFLVDVQR